MGNFKLLTEKKNMFLDGFYYKIQVQKRLQIDGANLTLKQV